MGFADRDYARAGYGGGGRPPGMFDGAPVVKWLVFSNVGIFLLGFLTSERYWESPLYDWGVFSIEKCWIGFELWRTVSFQFLHADALHLFMNMFGFYMFGRHVEKWMGSRAFTAYYFLCGVAGAVFYTALFYTPGFFENDVASQGMVGASAGLFGILVVFILHAPQAKILLFFFIPMQVRTAGILFFVYEVYVVVFDRANSGGSAGHLGGALCGFILLKNLSARRWLGSLNERKPAEARAGVRTAQVIREKKRARQETQEAVDRILDKVNEHGIQSLTSEERETLENAKKK